MENGMWFIVQSDGGKLRRIEEPTDFNFEFKNSERITVFERDSDKVLFYGKARDASNYLKKNYGIGNGLQITGKY